jgi:hypothetical protein
MGAKKPRIDVHAYPYWEPCSSHHNPVFKQEIFSGPRCATFETAENPSGRRTSLWYRFEALSDLDSGEWKIRGSGILLL